jgi:hypothetical protein
VQLGFAHAMYVEMNPYVFVCLDENVSILFGMQIIFHIQTWDDIDMS